MWFMGHFGYACLSHILFPAAADHSRVPPHTLHCCRLQSVQSSFFLLSSSSSIAHCPSSSLLRILVSLPDLLPRPYLLSSSPPHLPPHFSHLPQPFPTSFVSQWRFYIGARGAKPPQITKKEGFSPPKFQESYIIFCLSCK